jgi:hypothetical protein
LATKFREVLIADRREELMEDFPEAGLVGALRKTWDSSATGIYRNWLRYVTEKKDDVSKFSAVATVRENEYPRRKRSQSR